MYALLNGLRVIEASSFVASPSAGLYLAQFGAEVIRVDQIGGGPDFNRWPRAAAGGSLYWENLNRAKKSVALDLSRPEGRELLAALATAPGSNAGLFVTNFPVDGFLAHARLVSRRADLITVRVMGQSGGGPALDYTVNAAVGIPQVTGPADAGDAPVNHVLPAWDLLTGSYAAFALMAALHHRAATGLGQEIRIPLADVAIGSVANLGMLAEVIETGAPRERLGNTVYGAFGRDFVTADGVRLMIMAITPRQWTGLVAVLGIATEIAGIEAAHGVSFARDEGIRFVHRDALFALVAARVGDWHYAALAAAFDAQGCCYGAYQTMAEAVRDPELVTANPMFAPVAAAGGGVYPAAGSFATLPAMSRSAPQPAPQLGADSAAVLSALLGITDAEIAALIDKGIVGR